MTATLTRTDLAAIAALACRCHDPLAFGHQCSGGSQVALGDHWCRCRLHRAATWDEQGEPSCQSCADGKGATR